MNQSDSDDNQITLEEYMRNCKFINFEPGEDEKLRRLAAIAEPKNESIVASKNNSRPDGYTDAIHDVLQAAKDKLQPKKLSEPATLPHQFTFEQWSKAGTGFGTPKPTGTESSSCLHEWKFYQGLNFDDYYCIKCATTRPVDPSR